MAIVDLLNPPGPSSWYDELWLVTVEDNLDELSRINAINAVTVPSIDHVHFKNNFYGYLQEKIGVERKYWYTVMRLNHMVSPMEFDDNYDVILIPDFKAVEDLHNLYLASLRNR